MKSSRENTVFVGFNQLGGAFIGITSPESGTMLTCPIDGEAASHLMSSLELVGGELAAAEKLDDIDSTTRPMLASGITWGLVRELALGLDEATDRVPDYDEVFFAKIDHGPGINPSFVTIRDGVLLTFMSKRDYDKEMAICKEAT